MTTTPLRVAQIGAGFMGRAHSQAWATAGRFFALPLAPQLSVLVGTDAARTADTAERFGWSGSSTDWRSVIARDDIDVVDICSPGSTHVDIAIAALAAGKHVLCEKPLANSVVEAERMVAAAAAAPGLAAMCGFSYRRTPALALARRMVAEGRVGEIRHVRAQYLQDWLSDPDVALTWRLDRTLAGSGALGDIAAHSIDTAQWLTGDVILDVSAVLRTFVSERPAASGTRGLGGKADGAAVPRGPVTVDDAVAFTANFEDGALGVFEASRVALGRRNANRIELSGDRGSIAFDFERMNELEYYDASDPAGLQGFRRIQATEVEHPYAGNWWPVGHGLGYEHLFTHQVVDLVLAIAGERPAEPSFEQALGVQRVLAAVEASAADDSRRTKVTR
ncbi:MAG TPA: Gfo/Idh/MocA family oxidoreductase [Galbitalea sp.]|jgi:predicted dehydrogenase|nr:Gfo/Idh/MocA family oxidoreductase [Galbitalea sp.]